MQLAGKRASTQTPTSLCWLWATRRGRWSPPPPCWRSRSPWWSLGPPGTPDRTGRWMGPKTTGGTERKKKVQRSEEDMRRRLLLHWGGLPPSPRAPPWWIERWSWAHSPYWLDSGNGLRIRRAPPRRTVCHHKAPSWNDKRNINFSYFNDVRATLMPNQLPGNTEASYGLKHLTSLQTLGRTWSAVFRKVLPGSGQ